MAVVGVAVGAQGAAVGGRGGLGLDLAGVGVVQGRGDLVAAGDGVHPVHRVVGVADRRQHGAAPDLYRLAQVSVGRPAGAVGVVGVGGDRAGGVGGSDQLAVVGVAALGAGAVRVVHLDDVPVGVVLVADRVGRVGRVVHRGDLTGGRVVVIPGLLGGPAGALHVHLGELASLTVVGVRGPGAGWLGDGGDLPGRAVGVAGGCAVGRGGRLHPASRVVGVGGARGLGLAGEGFGGQCPGQRVVGGSLSGLAGVVGGVAGGQLGAVLQTARSAVVRGGGHIIA